MTDNHPHRRRQEAPADEPLEDPFPKEKVPDCLGQLLYVVYDVAASILYVKDNIYRIVNDTL